ncbi:MAG TPA: hypothetical protein VM689_22110 [Aliidongia sp.]|nr:hypothetical protein [Aliidongia sp.]
MPAIDRALRNFGAFLASCSIDGGLLFWMPCSFMLVLLIGSFLRVPPAARRQFWVLSILPAFWIFIGLWGGYFRFDWWHPLMRPPGWVGWPIEYGLWIFALAALALIVHLKAARAFALLFAAFNFYFMWWMTLFAGMAVTGIWL